MPELERATPPDSKWFWILLLVALFIVAILWFANPLGSQHVPPTGGPTSQSTPVDPAEAASPTVPLVLPSTTG